MRLRLARGLRLARVLLATQYAYMLEYRAEVALWALGGILPFIMLALWRQAGLGAGGLGAGLDPQQLTRYFLAVFVVRQFTIVWLIYSFEEDALQGKLSAYLLQPLQPLWRYVAAHVAEQVTRLPFVIAILAVFFLLDPAAFWIPSPAAVALTLLITPLAFALRFLLQSAITMVCFWSERASALERLLFIPYLYLSGLVAPLEVFPEGVRRLALWTPFPHMIAVPAQLLAGLPVDLGFSLRVMALWAALLLPLTLLLWRAGLRRYSAMGA